VPERINRLLEIWRIDWEGNFLTNKVPIYFQCGEETSDQGSEITIIERRLEAKFAKPPARRSHFLTSAPRFLENGYFAMSAQAIKCQELIFNSRSDGLSTEEDQAEFCRRSFDFQPKHGLRKPREAA